MVKELRWYVQPFWYNTRVWHTELAWHIRAIAYMLSRVKTVNIATVLHYTVTRKLCYRKDDRAMRLHMGALKIFGTPWLRPRPLFPTFHGLLFRSTLWMFLQNLKSVALPVPEIIGGYPKNLGNRQSLDTPTLHFLLNFERAFTWIGPVNVPAKFEVRSFTCSWDKMG